MTLQLRLPILTLSLALAACPQTPEPPKPRATTAPAAIEAAQAAAPAATGVAPSKGPAVSAHDGIAWRKGDVDAAFVAAKADNKPLFLYWGAVWCPPCNQVKATLFNRRDFIERSRFFVPVYIDGDGPSAQKLGARFNVVGYPTMILFNPDGREIVRLPGEADPEQYMRVLTMGMNGARPVKDTLAAALSGSRRHAELSADDWRMLAYYSWITDEQQLIPEKNVAPTLKRLAQACPVDQRETAVRLELKALAAAATAKDAKASPDAAATARLLAVLADSRLVRENFDMLTEYAGKIAGFVTAPKSPERERLVAAWTAALERLVADTSLSTADRLTAVTGEVALAKLDAKDAPLQPALLKTVRDEVARADRETTDPYARQAVIDAAASALVQAGLLDEADTLLKAELKRSHSPYYFMVDLAEVAKKRGDKAGALDWYAQSYAAAQGPATRVQWGTRYVNALVELAPQDVARIERAAGSVIGELEPVPDTFYDRNLRALERMGKKLAGWNKGPAQRAALERVRAQMAGVCAKLPKSDPARAKCGGALRPQSLKA
ncbi:MAG TPA: thioredoxin family protein [Casimicrobiaceae bacterium]|nr:thioredoxin family protein [Casimicrobiaceae bacterium]